MIRDAHSDALVFKKEKAALETNRLFYRNLTLERPDLFGAIVRFNASVNFEMNKDRAALNNGTPVPHDILKLSPRASASFYGRYLDGFWDFEEESRRMALLDIVTLKDLILSWGAAFCAPILNRFVCKKDFELLDRDIGRKYLDFARGKGRFNIGDISAIINIKEQSVSAEKVHDLIIGYGMHAHGICSSTWPESLQNIEKNRLKHHLPDFFEKHFQLDKVHPSHLRTIWFSMKKILLKEVAPQWNPCFS